MVNHEELEKLIWRTKTKVNDKSNKQLDRLIKYQIGISVLMSCIAWRTSHEEAFRHIVACLIGLIYFRSNFLYVKAQLLWSFVQLYVDVALPVKQIIVSPPELEGYFLKSCKITIQFICLVFYFGVVFTVATATKRKSRESIHRSHHIN